MVETLHSKDFWTWGTKRNRHNWILWTIALLVCIHMWQKCIAIGVFGGITIGTLRVRAKIISFSLEFIETTVGRIESLRNLLLVLLRIRKSCLCWKGLKTLVGMFT